MTQQIIFNVPDEHVQPLLNGTARYYGYQAILIDGENNPETKAQFGKRKIAATIRRNAIKGLLMLQQDAAAAITEPDIDPA